MLIPLFSLKRLAKTCLCCKSMLMTSYLDQPIKTFVKSFGKMMANEFEMSMIGELSYFLDLQIKQLKNGTFVSQGKYIKDMLKKFKIDDSKAISTPMGTSGSLDSDASGNMMDQKMYQSMIGSLLYVTASRPDVMFSVCMCARFQASLRESFERNQENIEVLKAYTKCWIVVSQRSKI